MADRPILFSAPMVRALLDGRKTQTRRIAKCIEPMVEQGKWHIHNSGGGVIGVAEADVSKEAVDYLPIQVGDRLWVREGVTRFDKGTCDQHIWYRSGMNLPYLAKAAGSQDGEWPHAEWPALGLPYNVPSIHMPRWASRITLIVTDVRVERLQDISEADAIDEGIVRGKTYSDYDIGTVEQDWFTVPGIDDPGTGISAVDMYSQLWSIINGADAWDANPFVAAYTFTVERKNIDEVTA